MAMMRSVGIAAGLLLLWCAEIQAQARLSDAELLTALRAGGNTIVLRYFPSNRDQADVDPANLKNIARQRQLSEQGKLLAKSFGDRLKDMQIPVVEVVTSRFNRCLQTAKLAGFANALPSLDLTEGVQVASPTENMRRAEALRKLVAKPLPPGQNRVIVTHRTNIMQALGKEWFDVKEGEASIFKVEGGAYSLVARLQIDDWGKLGRSAMQR
jgi:broad specificity phosphatase PhoE